MGVEKALTGAGARTGDEIRILSRAFAFEGVHPGADEPEDIAAASMTRQQQQVGQEEDK
jgi:hypothetical protein